MSNIVCSIDNREKERIHYAEKFFHAYKPSVVKLSTGDYVFENDDDAVVFEYKTMKDFINSVSNGRIFEQAKRINEEFNWSFIIIVGTIDDLMRENHRREFHRNTGRVFSLNQYYGAIARLNCYTTVVQCHNTAQAFNYIEKQALKIFDDKLLVKHFKNDADNPALNYMCCINGISQKTAKLIVDEFEINSLADLINTVENVDLTSINGIGKKTAEKITKNIKNGVK